MMEKRLDGKFILEGGIYSIAQSYWNNFDEVEVFPSCDEWDDGLVFGVSLSTIMIEWYEQVYKNGNSSVRFERNPL